MIKKISTIVDVASTEKNLKKNKNVVLNKGWKYIKQMWNELVGIFISIIIHDCMRVQCCRKVDSVPMKYTISIL